MSCVPTAAAVLALGVLQLSPMANTLGYLVCCRVSLVTVTKPVAGSARALVRTASGVDIGGEMCRNPYYKHYHVYNIHNIHPMVV